MVGSCLSLELEVSPKGCNREICSEQAGKHKEKGNPVPYPGNGRMACMANMPWQSTKHFEGLELAVAAVTRPGCDLEGAQQALQEIDAMPSLAEATGGIDRGPTKGVSMGIQLQNE